MKTKVVKVCGLKDQNSIEQVAELSVDWLGYIFYAKSPRYIQSQHFRSIKEIQGKKKIGVFVNETKDTILDIVSKCGLNMVQLHGDESPEECVKIREHIPVMKAIAIHAKEDLTQTKDYEGKVDYFLFDTKKAGLYGGTGEKFDWSVLDFYTGKTPFLLSGGIQLADVDHLNDFEHELCIGYDINSGFEIEPGKKSIESVELFLAKIKGV